MAITFTFDGVARTIQISADAADYVNNAITFSAKDIYGAWKNWCKYGDGLQYLPVFDTLGGDPITDTTLVGDYYFLRTDIGWRVLPPAINNVVLVLQGNLYPRVPGDMLFEPSTTYSTTLIMQTSSLTQTVVAGGGVQDANIVSVNGVNTATINDFKNNLTVNDIVAGIFSSAEFTQMQTDISELKDYQAGNWEIDTQSNQMIFYKLDGAVLAKFNLFNELGHPSTEVFKRVKA